MGPLEPVALAEILAAQRRLAGVALRTPLVRLNVEDAPAEIWLKLENLQPVGSFKMRGAGNAMLAAERPELQGGVWTASAGNMALGVAWHARCLGVPCTVIVPDDAPAVKLAAIRRSGARIIPVPFAEYQGIQRTRRAEGVQGLLIHPFADPLVMAGNGTIALEILEDLPGVEAVVAPYGGGGLSCGIAAALRALRPDVRVYGAEVETGAPLAASLAAGCPVETRYRPSFVSGIGAPFVFPQMWPLASQLLDGSLVATLAEVAGAIKLMAERNHIVAEGAAAAPVAAALAGRAGRGKVVCVVSGGNIDTERLLMALQGQVP